MSFFVATKCDIIFPNVVSMYQKCELIILCHDKYHKCIGDVAIGSTLLISVVSLFVVRLLSVCFRNYARIGKKHHISHDEICMPRDGCEILNDGTDMLHNIV